MEIVRQDLSACEASLRDAPLERIVAAYACAAGVDVDEFLRAAIQVLRACEQCDSEAPAIAVFEHRRLSR